LKSIPPPSRLLEVFTGSPQAIFPVKMLLQINGLDLKLNENQLKDIELIKKGNFSNQLTFSLDKQNTSKEGEIPLFWANFCKKPIKLVVK